MWFWIGVAWSAAGDGGVFCELLRFGFVSSDGVARAVVVVQLV